MATYQPSSSAELPSPRRGLPSGYTSIRDILDGGVSTGRLVSVIGLVKDYRVPIPTKGTDHKCAITIYDRSTEYDPFGIAVTIFRPQAEMPNPTAGDVLVINSARVQSYRESISLVTNKTTRSSIHTFAASSIPRPPLSAGGALTSSFGGRKLGKEEHEYISWFYHYTSKEPLPDVAEFQQLVDQSARRKDKFCRLKDVFDRKFCDVIVNVVKAPFDEMDRTSLWVSDYTENDSFYKFSWNGAKQLEGHDGDPHSHFKGGMDSATQWPGPFGKRSIQVTCFGLQAPLVKAEVQLDDWIRIRNLRIKLGRNGLNLEGALEDRNSSQQLVDILRCDGEECDPCLKEAIQRKKEYEKLKKQQLQSILANESRDGAGPKREANDNKKLMSGSKKRRKEQREEQREFVWKRAEEQDRQAEDRLGLNSLIKCESHGQPLTSLPSIIAPVLYKTTVNGEEALLTLPFTCAKYRTNVRVVDFRPRKLEHFATWRKSTEFDALSDYSSDSDSGSADDYRGSPVPSKGKIIWGWRFALHLEDADPKAKGKKHTLWAVVDDIEGQQLTNMDACDLRNNAGALHTLRERLFKLWGNLEEAKSQEQQRQITNLRRVAANQPPPSSPPNERASGAGNDDRAGISLSNKPFACCIRQYGVRIPESDPLWADAGEGYRWVRTFGLFGTKISH
ncbi:hypothetical protein F4802DRAFT_619750 [Xylaria palmicola]|nr:hypothetical protein F4802DRAFT_619750 [Xylaria palmicola]